MEVDGKNMGDANDSGVYERPKDPQVFDMFVIVGLVFNVLVVVFILLYWLDLL